MLTFGLGMLAVMAWLMATAADRTARHLLKLSLLYFLPLVLFLSIAVGLFVPELLELDSGSYRMWAGLGAVIIAEECIKLAMSRRFSAGIISFSFVSLFGIWELLLVKSKIYDFTYDNNFFNIYYYIFELAPLILHTLTAVIYSFYFRCQRSVQLAICIAIHITFNVTVVRLPLIFSFGMAIICLVVTIAIFPARGTKRRGTWCDTISKPKPRNSR